MLIRRPLRRHSEHWPSRREPPFGRAYDRDVDRLTGLASRCEFVASLPALSAQERFSLVLFDVDDLRALNGRYGHVEVDRLLALLGSVIRERCGVGEMGARHGGDEFAMSLLEDEPSEVIREVDHIRGRFGEARDGATFERWNLRRQDPRPRAGQTLAARSCGQRAVGSEEARSLRAEHLSRRVTPNTGPANLPMRLPETATCARGGGCVRAREELALLGEC